MLLFLSPPLLTNAQYVRVSRGNQSLMALLASVHGQKREILGPWDEWLMDQEHKKRKKIFSYHKKKKKILGMSG